MTEYRDLPKEYIQLEYIQSSGTQYIDTGITPNQDTTVVMDAEFISSVSGVGHLFGANSSGAYFTIRMNTRNDGFAFRLGNNALMNISSGGTINSRHTFKLGAGKCQIDDSTPSVITNTSFSGDYTIIISALNQAQKGGWCSLKIYSFKLEKGNTSLDLCPAKRISDGAIGMYDMVSKKFFTNAGSGSFTAGAEVKPSAGAYIGAPETVKLDESNLLSYFETDQLNDFDGTQFRLIRYDVLDAGGLQSVELIAKEDTVISFDYSFYRRILNGIFELYINSELIYTFSSAETMYKNKWSGRVLKNSSLKIELKSNTDMTEDVSVRTPMYVECTISNIQVSTPSMPPVARKITNAYIGVPEEEYEWIAINKDNYLKYFVVEKDIFVSDGNPLQWDSNNNYCVVNKPTACVWKAIDNNVIAISGKIDNNESDYMLEVGRGPSESNLFESSDGIPFDSNRSIRFWVRDAEGQKVSNIRIKIKKNSMKSVAHKITKAYIGVPTQIPIYEEHETTTIKDVETLITPSNISNFFTRSGNSYTFIGDSSGKFTSTNQNAHSTNAKSTWTAKKQIKKLTFSYRVSSERNYDKYSITVGDTIVADNISGNGSNQTYSGSLSSGGAIVLRYSKDGSTSSYDDCGTIWDIKVTTAETVTTTEKVQVGTETKEVARLCYQAPPQ